MVPLADPNPLREDGPKLFLALIKLSAALSRASCQLASLKCVRGFEGSKSFQFLFGTSLLLIRGWVNPVSYTHLTLPTNREV